MQNSIESIANRQSPSVMSAGAIPVSMARTGQSGRVVRIGGTSEVKKFLSDIGFTVGATVSAVSDLKGSKILNIRGSKVAIDSRMASKIMICPE